MNGRIAGLDFLRSVIMFFGPTFHTSMVLTGAWGFSPDFESGNAGMAKAVLGATQHFRMELFFTIAGFFSLLVIERKGRGALWGSKIRKLFIPTLVACAVIVPLCAAIMHGAFGVNDLRELSSPRHVWFLTTLSIISLIHFIFYEQISAGVRYLAALLEGRSFIYAVIAFSALTLFFKVLASIAFKFIGFLHPWIPVVTVVEYLPYFLMGGCLLFIYSVDFQKLLVPSIVLYVPVYIMSLFMESGQWSDAVVALMIPLKVVLCLSIFQFARNFGAGENRLIKGASRLSLLFYLIHLPILFLLFIPVNFLTSNAYVYAVILIVLDIVLSLALSWALLTLKAVRVAVGQQ